LKPIEIGAGDLVEDLGRDQRAARCIALDGLMAS